MKNAFLSLALMLLFGTAMMAQSSKVVTAMNALASGEYMKAKEAIDIAAQNEKTMNEARTWLYRGRIYNMIARDTTGKYAMVENPLDAALESFRRGLTMEDVKNYRSDIADELYYTYNLYYTKGATAYNAGDIESAYHYFSKASEANKLQIDANPKAQLDTGVILNIAITARATDRNDEAIKIFSNLIEMKYQESVIYRDLAEIYVETGQLEEARKVIENGRTAYPMDKEIMIAELNYYLNQNRLSELVPKLNSAIDLDPENVELYVVLGTSHVELIKLDSTNAQMHFMEAEKAFVKALSFKPDRFDINLNLGALYYNAAIELNKLLRELPLDKEAEYEKMQAERNGLYTKALPYFEKAHQVDPDDVPTMQALKEIYVRLGMESKAEEIKQKLE